MSEEPKLEPYLGIEHYCRLVSQVKTCDTTAAKAVFDDLADFVHGVSLPILFEKQFYISHYQALAAFIRRLLSVAGVDKSAILADRRRMHIDSAERTYYFAVTELVSSNPLAAIDESSIVENVTASVDCFLTELGLAPLSKSESDERSAVWREFANSINSRRLSCRQDDPRGSEPSRFVMFGCVSGDTHPTGGLDNDAGNTLQIPLSTIIRNIAVIGNFGNGYSGVEDFINDITALNGRSSIVGSSSLPVGTRGLTPGPVKKLLEAFVVMSASASRMHIRPGCCGQFIDNVPASICSRLEADLKVDDISRFLQGCVTVSAENGLLATELLDVTWAPLKSIPESSHWLPNISQNVHVTVFRTEEFNPAQEVNFCKDWSEAFRWRRDVIWNLPSRKLVVMCLSSKNAIDLAKIYTNPKKYHEQGQHWAQEITARILDESQIPDLRVLDKKLSLPQQSRSYFYILFSFDGVLHRHVKDVWSQIVRRSCVEISSFSLLPNWYLVNERRQPFRLPRYTSDANCTEEDVRRIEEFINASVGLNEGIKSVSLRTRPQYPSSVCVVEVVDGLDAAASNVVSQISAEYPEVSVFAEDFNLEDFNPEFRTFDEALYDQLPVPPCRKVLNDFEVGFECTIFFGPDYDYELCKWEPRYSVWVCMHSGGSRRYFDVREKSGSRPRMFGEYKVHYWQARSREYCLIPTAAEDLRDWPREIQSGCQYRVGSKAATLGPRAKWMCPTWPVDRPNDFVISQHIFRDNNTRSLRIGHNTAPFALCREAMLDAAIDVAVAEPIADAATDCVDSIPVGIEESISVGNVLGKEEYLESLWQTSTVWKSGSLTGLTAGRIVSWGKWVHPRLETTIPPGDVNIIISRRSIPGNCPRFSDEGDSGGPVFIVDSDGRARMVGIVHSGITLGGYDATWSSVTPSDVVAQFLASLCG